ncbi:hypothetical protein ACFL27_16675 [candidate division CSSED10-310 bacterium]|uniref:Uncharacterized protein n=1 Tax=candidate division CSSED10-310 bacterium TaxID=2855610 RepID=A0ABV6Z045_UNCC1
MGWFGDSEKKLDEDREKNLTRLFKQLDQEQDPEKKKVILAKIRKIQEDYKETKKKKAKWKFFN